MKQRIQDHFSFDTLDTIVERQGSAVYRAQRHGETWAVKVFESAKVYEQETDALSRLYPKGVPVPRLVEKAIVGDRYIMLQEWWDSEPLLAVYPTIERSVQEKFVYESGQLLARLQFALSPAELAEAHFWHRFDFTDLSQFTWREYLQAQVGKILGRIQVRDEDLKLGLEQACLIVTNKVKELSEPERLTLTHNDYGLRNLLVSRDRQRFLGVIDFEYAQVGDPLADLAKFSWNDLDMQDTELFERFIAGWESKSGLQADRRRLTLYQAYIGMGSVGWVDKHTETNPEMERFRKRGLEALVHYAARLVEHPTA